MCAPFCTAAQHFTAWKEESKLFIFKPNEYHTESAETPLTPDLLLEWLAAHERECRRHRCLQDLYLGRHPILLEPKKEPHKPDNRIVCNFPKYLVDTLNGYFIGEPVKTICQDAQYAEKIEQIQQRNDQDDNNAELSKICSIYGCGYEFLYSGDDSLPHITYANPLETFVVYDDTVERKPLYGVRYYYDRKSVLHGSVFTDTLEIPFHDSGGLHFLEERTHKFHGVPVIEYIENEERTGVFEHVITQILAYDKAISEKANDVDYFADAYLKILGAKLSQEDLQWLRNNRIINMEAPEMDKLEVEFLQKPNADTTQENLLDRLEDQIFNLSMVANISDENFGNSSGTALAYKLLSMDNLCRMKARKFVSGMNQRWKILATHPLSGIPEDIWTKLDYQFTRNTPKNLLEEVQAAAQMAGITSQRTQLRVISAVDNVDKELERIQEEQGKEPQDDLRQERTVTEPNDVLGGTQETP